MKIYVSHASSFDYNNELYAPLEKWANENGHKLFLPHKSSDQPTGSRQQIAASDLVLAEVSYPSTGQGIELGWADSESVPIFAVHRHNHQPSSSVKLIALSLQAYDGETSLSRVLTGSVNNKA